MVTWHIHVLSDKCRDLSHFIFRPEVCIIWCIWCIPSENRARPTAAVVPWPQEETAEGGIWRWRRHQAGEDGALGACRLEEAAGTHPWDEERPWRPGRQHGSREVLRRSGPCSCRCVYAEFPPWITSWKSSCDVCGCRWDASRCWFLSCCPVRPRTRWRQRPCRSCELTAAPRKTSSPLMTKHWGGSSILSASGGWGIPPFTWKISEFKLNKLYTLPPSSRLRWSIWSRHQPCCRRSLEGTSQTACRG